MDKMLVFVSVRCFCLLISLHRNTMLLNCYTMILCREREAILFIVKQNIYTSFAY